MYMCGRKTYTCKTTCFVTGSMLFFSFSFLLLFSRRPFPHPLRRLHFGFDFMPINPRLISCCDVLKKVFVIICNGKQFLTDFNTGSLSERQSANVARILHRRDASEVFQ
jgi:hypothetical protein